MRMAVVRPAPFPPRPVARARPAAPGGRGDLRARLLKLLLITLTLGITLFAQATAMADSYDDRRVRAGARLFRALLAADTALETKAAPDGALHVVIIGGDRGLNDDVSALISPTEDAEKARIRGLNVSIARHATLADIPADGGRLVGVFLASAPPQAELDKLIRWSIEKRVILYSPFEGHVERGATAGIVIESKVQPYLNAKTVQATGLELKPFFLKVAKVLQP